MPVRKTLYRKYRPISLDQVVGQTALINALSKAIKSGNFAHAYLFIGPRGTGKTSVARIFAHAINKFDYQIEDHYPDIVELDAASYTSVNDIRELCEKAVIAPSQGKYKVYIIDEVHMLSKSAFNALLKTLEEPPTHVVFLMATTNPEKIPITVRSRAQTFTFQLADPDTLTSHLRQIADIEKIDITDDALRLLAKRSGGSFRDALSLLDQLATTFTKKITVKTIEQAFGLPQTTQIHQLLSTYQTGDLAQITSQLQTILSTGIQPQTLAAELTRAIINDPQPAYLPLLNKLTNINGDFAMAKLLLALAPEYATPTRSLATTVNGWQTHRAPELQPPSPAPQSASESPQSPSQPAQLATKNPLQTPPETPSRQAPQPLFSFLDYRESFHAEHAALYSQLGHCDYVADAQTLHLYPQSSVCRKILTSPNNQRLLVAATSLNLQVHELGERPTKTAAEDSPLAQISAIMGTVQEVKPGNSSAPF